MSGDLETGGTSHAIGEGLELHSDAAKHYAKYPVPRDPGGEERIDQEAQAAIFTGLPMSATDRKALGGNEAARSRIPVQEYLGTLDLNKIRYLLGLSMLHIDEKLADAARDHSKDMHTLGFFAHKSPVAGKTNFGQRAANFGTSAGAENIAAGQGTGAETGMEPVPLDANAEASSDARRRRRRRMWRRLPRRPP